MPAPPDVATAAAAVRPEEVLARWWPGPCSGGCLCLEPFTDTFPGLVRAGSPDRSTRRATLAAAASFGRDAHARATLGVVDAVRAADVPAALGWSGACNYGERGDLIGITAVLRSWEERFGAVLVEVRESTLVLAVADPPRTLAEAERVAAEHFAFCPDQQDPQTHREPFTLRSYARTIHRTRSWRFWWD